MLHNLPPPSLPRTSKQTPQPRPQPNQTPKRMHNARPPPHIMRHPPRDHRIAQRRQKPTQQHDSQTPPHRRVERLSHVVGAQRQHGGSHGEVADAVGVDVGQVGLLGGGEGEGLYCGKGGFGG